MMSEASAATAASATALPWAISTSAEAFSQTVDRKVSLCILDHKILGSYRQRARTF